MPVFTEADHDNVRCNPDRHNGGCVRESGTDVNSCYWENRIISVPHTTLGDSVFKISVFCIPIYYWKSLGQQRAPYWEAVIISFVEVLSW
jgi:hypothetical protein